MPVRLKFAWLIPSKKAKYQRDELYFRAIKNLFGFRPGNIELYKQALRHNSVSVEVGPDRVRNSNERLEYLGDAVLSCIVAEFLFKKFPFKEEGFLTEMRSRIVSREQLSQLAQKMGLQELIEFDASVRANPFSLKSISGNALEAVIGAIYLDTGYNFTRKVVRSRIIDHYLDLHQLLQTESNFKSKLLNYSQKNKQMLSFELLETTGKGHYKLFRVRALLDGNEVGKGEDFSKKKAEQLAAEDAWRKLNLQDQE